MSAHPLVGVIMGSKSDWDVMRQADEVLTKFGVEHECRVLSAHRTPTETPEYVSAAEGRGMEVIIAAAGGAAHLAGVCAAHTLLPVLGVPMESAALKGMDSLLSTVQMPAGIPVGTLAIGAAGRAQCGAAGDRDPGQQPPEIARPAAPVPRRAERQGAAGNPAVMREPGAAVAYGATAAQAGCPGLEAPHACYDVAEKLFLEEIKPWVRWVGRKRFSSFSSR